MTEAARLAPHLAGPAWILAFEQTAGHGRRGRPWRAPAGNFTASYVFRPGVAPDQAALYSFVSALALHDGLSQACGPHARLALKWPNDVLLNGGKVSGILLETLASPTGTPGVLVCGLGVNLRTAPERAGLEEGAVPAASVLGETGCDVSADAFLDLLAPAFDRYARSFATYGFAPIREAWLARATRLGEVIHARTGRETYTGVFETIDAQGALVLRQPEGRRVISAADIFF